MQIAQNAFTRRSGVDDTSIIYQQLVHGLVTIDWKLENKWTKMLQNYQGYDVARAYSFVAVVSQLQLLY